MGETDELRVFPTRENSIGISQRRWWCKDSHSAVGYSNSYAIVGTPNPGYLIQKLVGDAHRAYR